MRRVPWLLLLGLASSGCNAFGGAEKELAGAGGASHGSSSAASSVGGSTSSGSGVEDCTNGVDDNGDGLVDCDDPQCQDFECVDAPPAGWTKPGAFYLGASMNQIPDCPPNDPAPKAQGGFGLMFDDCSCHDCGCDSRSGQSCDRLIIDLYQNATDCTGTKQVNMSTDNRCATGLFDGMSVETTTNYVAGTCPATGGEVLFKPAPTFSKRGEVCEPDAVGKCSQKNAVCAAKIVDGAFGPKACTSKSGDQACPTGYPNKTVLYQDTTDTRGCGMCVCNPPANDCKATVTYFEGGNGDCNASNPPGTAVTGTLGVCQSVPPQILSVKFGVLTWPSATDGCTPSGGQPTGTVVGAMPITVCCR
jgi:hypothetical protein